MIFKKKKYCAFDQMTAALVIRREEIYPEEDTLQYFYATD